MEAERARIEIDVSGLIAEAIRAKEAEAAERYSSIEETPSGESLTWHTTAEEIARINAGDRAALDRFYFEPDNYRHLKCCAWSFFRKQPYFRPIISDEDLKQQLYCDLRTGLLKFRPYDRAIRSAIYHSFRYAAVGGIDEIYIPNPRARRCGKCRKQAN